MNEQPTKQYKAAIYVRRKFKDVVLPGEEDLTTSEQIRRIKEIKEEYPDVSIEAIYMDRKRISKEDPRPEFIHFLRDIHTGKYNCVILYSIETFGKGPSENEFYLLKQFPMLRLRIILIKENYDSEISEPIKGLYNRLVPLLETSAGMLHSRRCTTSNRRNKETAIVSGSNTPYGYLFDPDSPQCVAIDPVTAPAVALIFQEYVAGTPIRSIIKQLEEGSYPTPSERKIQLGYWSERMISKYWKAETITQIIRRSFYVGDLEIKERINKEFYQNNEISEKWKTYKLVNNHHTALVSREMFEKAQILYQLNYESNPKNYREKHMHIVINPLCSYVHCTSCGSKMRHVKYSTKGRYDHGFFRCPSVKRGNPKACKVLAYKDEDLEKLVINAIEDERRIALQLAVYLKETGENTLYAKGLRKYDALIKQYTDALTKLQLETSPDNNSDLFDSTGFDDPASVKKSLLDAINGKREFTKLMSCNHPWIRNYLRLPETLILNNDLMRTFIDRINVYTDAPPCVFLKNQEDKKRLLELVDFAQSIE